MTVPENRIRALNQQPIRARGSFVLYWMVAARRTTFNFSLDRALEHANELERPLVVLEPLRIGYRWACDRFHAFVLGGMGDNHARFESANVTHHPYLELRAGDGSGLLSALAASASVVVTDDFPCFFLPRMQRAAAQKLDVRVEAVDPNGILPIHLAGREFARAYDFRRFLQKNVAEALQHVPMKNPLGRAKSKRVRLAKELTRRWPSASSKLLAGNWAELGQLDIDHDVAPSRVVGGSMAGARALASFVKNALPSYADSGRHPDEHATSGLSPYLHFGHVGAYQVFDAVARSEGWEPNDLGTRQAGQKEGFWRMSQSAEAFLDQVVTWRELGFNLCVERDDYARYASLPSWAKQSLEGHEKDARPWTYDLSELESARTHDDIWNAAQRQLAEEGFIHNYLRMLWGKKILEWSPSARVAAKRLVILNDKYALDGRDPNSYSGIFWCLGRYDRPWPEREVFGTVRYMSSDSTRKKLHMKDYLARFTGDSAKPPVRSRKRR